MNKWKITGINLSALIIEAESFDEALAQARTINRNYTTGQIISKEAL